MRRTPDDNTRLFDAWAETYDQDISQPLGPLTGYAGSLALASSQLTLPPAASLLDIGIGTGKFAQHVAQADTRVHGIDISPEMLKRCQEHSEEWDLRHGSFEDIPYPAGSFDVIISSFAFHEVGTASRTEVLMNISRSLRPHGQLCLLDIMFASEAAMQHAKARIGRYWDDSEEYPVVDALDAQLRFAGFNGLRWTQSGPYHWIVTAQSEQ